MKSPVRLEKADPTLVIHLPAVNLETTTISCRKAPVATNLRHTITRNCSFGGKRQTSDSLMPYPVFYKIAKEEEGWATESIPFK